MFDRLIKSFGYWRLWWVASVYTVVLEYRRTWLGTVWLVAGISAVVALKSFLFAGILSVDLARLIPSLALGMAIWRLILGYVLGGARAFISFRGILSQRNYPLFVPILANMSKAVFTFLHALVAMLVFSFYFYLPSPLEALLALAGLVLLTFAAIPIGFILAHVATRFRDIENALDALMTVSFIVTPIIWLPEMAKGPREWFLTLNPFYHAIEIVRDPIIGQPIDLLNWYVMGGIAASAWLIALLVDRVKHRTVLLWL